MNRRNSDEIIQNLEGEERLKFQEEYPKQIIYLLECGFYTCYYINSHLTTESRNAIWNQKVQEDLENRKGKNIVLSSSLVYFQQWMMEKKIPPSFYPYFIIGSGLLWGVLTGSIYNKSYDKLYNEKILGSPETNEPQNLKNVIDETVKIIQIVKPDFNRNSIKFKTFGEEFQDEVVCFNNNILYFSDKLANASLDRLKKFWLLETVCHFFKIDAYKLLINSCPFFK